MKKMMTAVAIATASLAAQAQGFYAGAGVGFNSVKNELSQFNSDMVDSFGGSISSKQDTSVRNLRLLGGYKVNENVAIEVGYLKSSDFALTFSGQSGGNVSYSGKGTVSFSGVDVATVLRPSIASGYNNLFATVGVHRYKANVGIGFSVAGTNYSDNSSDSGTGTLFGIGYDWKIAEGVDVRWSLTRLNKLAGDSESKTTNVGVGLIKHF
jgi:OmpA-like transmembrane domain